ncbi:4-(cytidine 5'-diphospho)-2-C-methyl-D-erythritol kinase [Chloroflexota bacterium]
MKLTACAKINLTLEVLGKRADGYHEIVSVLQNIGLADTLYIEPAEELSLHCNVPSLESDDNLVLKGARLLREVTGYDGGALIRLTKGTPVASGLGAGSSDAVATLMGLNKLWELQLSKEELLDLSLKLGSDTAFFFYGGTALAEGRGDRVTPAPLVPGTWLVLLIPAIEPIPNKTAQLYSRLNASHFTSGEYANNFMERLKQKKMVNNTLLFNVFEQVAFDFFPQLNRYCSRFLAAGAESVHLAGAGPTLFTLISDRSCGENLLNNLKEESLEAYLIPATETSVIFNEDE